MDIETVSYTIRQAMVRGVMTMTGDGWQVCGISTLAHNCYRVEYARQVAPDLADDSHPTGQTVGHRELARQQPGRTAHHR
jgi:hypothetical protein